MHTADEVRNAAAVIAHFPQHEMLLAPPSPPRARATPMADGMLPRNGPKCIHGLRVPSAVAMIVAARKLYEQDWATAVAISVDWCDVCHSPAFPRKDSSNG